MKNMRKPAVQMSRISDPKQANGFSREAQEKLGKKYIDENGLELVTKPFSFIESASKAGKRTKFGEMMKFIKKYVSRAKVPLHLVVEKKDRLSRNFTSLEQLQEWVIEGKVVIHYYKDNKIVDHNSTPADILFDDINTAMAKYMALNNRRETKKGMMEKAQQGWYPSRPPTGYKNMKTDEVSASGKKISIIVKDPDERIREGIVRMFYLRAIERRSYSEIAKIIIEEKIFPPNFYRSRSLSKSGVEGIIKNPFYEGRYKWQGVWCNGKHELFVPLEYIRAIREQGTKPPASKSEGLLSSFLTCSECGCSIVYDPKKKLLKSTGELKTYKFYHCSDGKRLHRQKGHKQVCVYEDKILELMSECVSEISLSKELAEKISRELKKSHSKIVANHKKAMSKLEKEIENFDAKENRYLELLEEDSIDIVAYKRIIAKLRDEKSKAERQLLETAEQVSSKFYETADRIFELAKNAESFSHHT